MRQIDADRLLRPDMIRMCYHLPNGDIAMPISDIEHAPTVDAVPLDKLYALLGENADCPPEHDRCKGNCVECWKSVLEEWMKEYDQDFL